VVPGTVIENVTIFSAFCNPLALRDLWNGHFFELADNGLLGCSGVVGVNSRKWSYFGGTCSQLGARWLAGWVGPGVLPAEHP
jgi:hypothetical protein